MGKRFANALTMQMRYPYVNPPGMPKGDWRRTGVVSPTTYDAILAGERTATTRFPKWYRRNSGQLDRVKAIQPGEIITFTSYGRPDLEVIAKPSKLSYQQMELGQQRNIPQLQGLGGATYALSLNKLDTDPRYLDRWSQLEGWSPEAGRQFFGQEPAGYGYQFQYELPF